MSKEDEDRIQKNNDAVERQAWERHPIDVFADVIELYEDGGVVRISFRCSRPDISDPLGAVSVVVSRVTIPWEAFNRSVRPFQDKITALYAATDAQDPR